jgi:hypothetical protein
VIAISVVLRLLDQPSDLVESIVDWFSGAQ